MTILKPLRFTLVAFGGAVLALLAFAASQALATTTLPFDAFAWPSAGSGGTASTVLGVVSVAIVALGASLYGYVALRRAYALAETPRRFGVVDGGRERETDIRKAA